MVGLTKLALAVIVAVAAVSLLVFSAELLYILHYRRKLRRAAGPTGDLHSKFSCKSLLLSALRLKSNRVRVEPAAPPPTAVAAEKAPADDEEEVEEEELDLAAWRAACLGPSRVLYTIKEEEREGADLDLELGSDKDDGRFETPYYTPVSSPARV